MTFLEIIFDRLQKAANAPVMREVRDGKMISVTGSELPPWTIRFKVAASALRRLPERLREERVGLSIWQSHLRLGSWLYQGSPDGFSTTDPSRIQ